MATAVHPHGDASTMSYPEPTRSFYSPAPPLDHLGLSQDSYIPAYPRSVPDSYPATMANARSLYAEAPPMLNGRASPSLYPDDDTHLSSSNLSTASAASSTMGSPISNHGQLPNMSEWAGQGLGLNPGIVDPDCFSHGGEYSYSNLESFNSSLEGVNPAYEYAQAKSPYVDPSLIQPDVRCMPMPPYESAYPPPGSAYPGSPALSAPPQLRAGSSSPFLNNYTPYSPYSVPLEAPPVNRSGIVSYPAPYCDQNWSGDESREKQKCQECGKAFKDLKAHMLTHQTERPEKCPIASCDYHIKGFARKYDKNRHTLTHYKGTMVCGFCPGSGSNLEKSFNRADVFKRHLTAVHAVEQTAPNSRKKAPGAAGNSGNKLSGYASDATGKCSTCSQTFFNAQDFYEHLDDCVLRIVQQEDPAEAINASRLAEVEHDQDVHDTLKKNNLPTATMTTTGLEDEEDETMVESDDPVDEDSIHVGRGPIKTSGTSPNKRPKGNPPNGVQKSRGMTHSRGGVSGSSSGNGGRGRKNRRENPSSWGFNKSQMTMKKRVLAVFDGPRRLAKDDMMLSTEHEVRVPLPGGNGNAYVTDLDVHTLRRAEGFLGATDEEKGPWVSDDPTDADYEYMAEGPGARR